MPPPIAADLGEDLGDGSAEHHVGEVVHLGGFRIDDHNTSACRFRRRHHRSDRIDGQRRAHRQHQVAILSSNLGTQQIPRHELLALTRDTSRWDQYRLSFDKALDAYLTSVREGGEPPVPGLAGLQELQFEAALKRSIRLGRPVQVQDEFRLD